jgi:putative oxidoreductase
MEIGLLLLRLGVGLTLAAHGAQKLFGWFGGYGLEGTGKGLETLGFLPGRRKALMAGLAEFGGGVLLALGFITPLAGALVVGVMLVAGVSAHARKGFFATAGGYEYILVLAVSGLTPAFTGPGQFSLDSLLGLHLDGAVWGAAATIVGLLAGAIELGSRRPAPAPEPANAR